MQKTKDEVVEVIEKWLAAVRAGNTEEASTLAAKLPVVGARLCNHPDFRRFAEALHKGMDATTALEGASWLLMCLAELEAREGADAY